MEPEHDEPLSTESEPEHVVDDEAEQLPEISPAADVALETPAPTSEQQRWRARVEARNARIAARRANQPKLVGSLAPAALQWIGKARIKAPPPDAPTEANPNPPAPVSRDVEISNCVDGPDRVLVRYPDGHETMALRSEIEAITLY